MAQTPYGIQTWCSNESQFWVSHVRQNSRLGPMASYGNYITLWAHIIRIKKIDTVKKLWLEKHDRLFVAALPCHQLVSHGCWRQVQKPAVKLADVSIPVIHFKSELSHRKMTIMHLPNMYETHYQLNVYLYNSLSSLYMSAYIRRLCVRHILHYQFVPLQFVCHLKLKT